MLGLTAARAAFSHPPAVHAAKRYEWKMASAVPASLPGAGTNAVYLAKIIETMSRGRITIRFFGQDQLSPAFETLNLVADGKAEIGYGSPYYWRKKHEAFSFCTNIPFGLNAHEFITWLQFGGGGELLDELYAKYNLKPFPAGNTGSQMGGWYNREIASVLDYKGLKIRMPGLGGDILARAGAEIVNLPSNRILHALQSGKIDAAEWAAPCDDLRLELYKAASFYYWPGWHEPGALADCFVNKDAYASLPGDLQEIIRQASFAAYNHMWSEYSAKNGTALVELVVRHQVKMKRFPDRVLMDMARLSRDVMTEIANRNPLSKKIYDSYTAFGRKAIAWTQISEEAFSLARSLTFSYL